MEEFENATRKTCTTSLNDGVSSVHDIEKRFEQLETQWLSFQKRAANWEADKETSADNFGRKLASFPYFSQDHLGFSSVPSGLQLSASLEKERVDQCGTIHQSISPPLATPGCLKNNDMVADGSLNETWKEFQRMLTEVKLQPELVEEQQALHSQENGQLESKLNSLKTGTLVLCKLCTALKDMLVELEQRDKVFLEIWNELKKVNGAASELKDHFLWYEPKHLSMSFTVSELEGLSRLASGSDAEKWCTVISAICQRFVAFLAKESHLEEWAISLEKESIQLLKTKGDVMEARTSAIEQSEHAAALMNNAEEQIQIVNKEKEKLAKERERLALWVAHLQERRKVVTEMEKESALSLAGVQKRAAEISMRESSMDEKLRQIAVLEGKHKATSHSLQNDRHTVDRERLQVQEEVLKVKAKEKDLESQIHVLKKKEEDLKQQWEQLRNDRLAEEKERETVRAAIQEAEEKLVAKELILKDIEKDLEGKILAADSVARKLNAREKVLKNIEKQCEVERVQNRDLLGNLQAEKKTLEATKEELEMSKKSADEAWSCISAEHDEAAEYIHSVDENLKLWEGRLKEQEKELLKQQDLLRIFESQLKQQQDEYHMLHANSKKEQEKRSQDLKIWEDDLKNRQTAMEREEEKVRQGLARLQEEKKIAEDKLTQAKEIKARTQTLEQELSAQYSKHLLEAKRQEHEYKGRVIDLETLKRDLEKKGAESERKFQVVRARKKELKMWQRKVEDALDTEITKLCKEKEALSLAEEELAAEKICFQKFVEERESELLQLEKSLQKRTKSVTEKENDLTAFEASMCKSREAINEEKECLSKLEVQVKERLKRAEEMEERCLDLQSGWEKLKEEQVALATAKESLRLAREELLRTPEMQNEDFRQRKFQGTGNLESLKIKPDKQLKSGEHNESVGDEVHLDVGTGVFEAQERSRKQLEESIQQEAARLIQERENLKAQQNELKETRKAVQEAKSTLTVQLKATKKMVANASMTAQRASREREALEEERKCLAKVQEEMKIALSAREGKIALEEEQLEKIRQAIEEEKAEAMDIVFKAEQMKKVLGAMERNRDNLLNAPESNTILKALHETALDEDAKQPFEVLNHPLPTDSQLLFNTKSEWDEISIWREQECAMIEKEEKMVMDEINRLHNLQFFPLKDKRVGSKEEFTNRLRLTPFPALTNMERNPSMICHENVDKRVETPRKPNSGTLSYDDTFGPAIHTHSGSSIRIQEDSPEVLGQQKHSSAIVQDNCISFFEENAPSQKRLENVMTSLLNARQASRNRLQRTESLLATLPSAGGRTSDVKQGLNTLAGRLAVMEQMEEELSNQLKEVYNTISPDSEGVIVDKMKLLCRMEEQQTLRAEWEGEMQRQLEKISSLQINPLGPSAFNTPIKQMTFDELLSPSSFSNSSEMIGSGDCHGQFHGTLYDTNNDRAGPQTKLVHFDETNLFDDLAFPEWSRVLETSHEGNSNNFPNSPLVVHTFKENLTNHGHINLSSRELTYERNARRRLLLSKSKGAHVTKV